MALAAKAHAGGLGGAVLGVIIAALESWPLFLSLPSNVQTALESLVSALLVWLMVYLSPPNTLKEE